MGATDIRLYELPSAPDVKLRELPAAVAQTVSVYLYAVADAGSVALHSLAGGETSGSIIRLQGSAVSSTSTTGLLSEDRLLRGAAATGAGAAADEGRRHFARQGHKGTCGRAYPSAAACQRRGVRSCACERGRARTCARCLLVAALPPLRRRRCPTSHAVRVPQRVQQPRDAAAATSVRARAGREACVLRRRCRPRPP